MCMAFMKIQMAVAVMNVNGTNNASRTVQSKQQLRLACR